MASATPAFLDAHVAAGRGARLAIETPSARLTYGALLDVVCRVGRGLRDLGVEREQRVAMLLPDGVAWAAVFFGALRIGAVAVPLNTRLPRADWAGLVRDSGAVALIADASLLGSPDDVREALPGVRVVALRAVEDEPVLDALLGGAGPLPPEPVDDDAMAFWLYTSGTTGRPKAAVHLHRDLLACRHYGVDVLGASGDDRIVATSRLFFAYALGNALLIPLFVGACTSLQPAWPEPALLADTVRRFRPTLFFSVPTVYARLLRAGLPADCFASLRSAVSAGERLPPEIHAEFRAHFGVEILDGLGATETIFMVLSNRPGRSRAGTVGMPVPGTEAVLRDGEGREVPAGTPGVLHVRTPSASPRYWARPEESRHAFPGGWFRTGDICTRDADGVYTHAGRADDLFKVAGMWVAPADVEVVLIAHAGVADAGVVGAEADGGLVKPHAWIVPSDPARAGATLLAELEALVVEKLPPHQRPRAMTLTTELPRTATGKLQRYVLREWIRS